MTPSSDSTHSLVSSGSMSGSWLGRPSLITGRLRSVATGIPQVVSGRLTFRSHCVAGRAGIVSNAILPRFAVARRHVAALSDATRDTRTEPVTSPRKEGEPDLADWGCRRSVSTRQIDCQVPSASRPPQHRDATRTGPRRPAARGRGRARASRAGAATGRRSAAARRCAVEQVVVGAGAGLDDRDARRSRAGRRRAAARHPRRRRTAAASAVTSRTAGRVAGLDGDHLTAHP